jgi:hypothetical protein
MIQSRQWEGSPSELAYGQEAPQTSLALVISAGSCSERTYDAASSSLTSSRLSDTAAAFTFSSR